ncbi:unnamed protein product [Triticum turgidum subsp. durum]|uniref:Origin of replication complex subunit 6 n=1 Tax=Triticum turgidum subsp. durum TaxID=4567 RepID=A0A9R0WNA7_TRITD|nr:unnamed protein product [Triticum turgidum subsp. durum]
MDMSAIAARLGLSGSRPFVRKAAELRRLCDINFDSSVLGIGEVCKAIICLEVAATKFQVMFDRSEAVQMSGMSEKAYIRSFNALQNGLGVKTTLDVRELGIQFGCVRLIPFVQKGLVLYKERFLAALPPSRRSSTDFGRPMFTAAAFYLCAKRHKLKVDKLKLIDLCGTSSSGFTTVSTSMGDLCFDVFGIAKEKKDPTSIKGNRELLDVLPSKRKHEDESSGDDNDDKLDNGLGSYQPTKGTRGWRNKLQSVEVFSYLHQQANQTRPCEAQEASSAELQEETARRRLGSTVTG